MRVINSKFPVIGIYLFLALGTVSAGSIYSRLSEDYTKANAEETTTFFPLITDNATEISLNQPNNTLNETLSLLTVEDRLAFQLKRNLAIRNVLRRVLEALGPEFLDRLPNAPTNATITPFNSTIQEVDSEACPEYYKRCSSQTFFPSCQIPRNTDEQMWNQRFTLFFNIASEISSINRQDILNATLRLYKNLSLPLDTPKNLIVKLHVIIRGLQRNREKTRLISSTRVMSDFVGWVFLDVYKLVKRLKSNNNYYGIKISIQDENNIPWNVPNLFIKMDCQDSNRTFTPLPFEVMQFENDTQRFPALNIRSGSQESIEDNDYLYESVHSNTDRFTNYHSGSRRSGEFQSLLGPVFINGSLGYQHNISLDRFQSSQGNSPNEYRGLISNDEMNRNYEDIDYNSENREDHDYHGQLNYIQHYLPNEHRQNLQRIQAHSNKVISSSASSDKTTPPYHNREENKDQPENTTSESITHEALPRRQRQYRPHRRQHMFPYRRYQHEQQILRYRARRPMLPIDPLPERLR